jgi:hypothetical protein
MSETQDELAERIDAIGRRVAQMPFGEPGSPERRERDRLSDIAMSLEARRRQMRRDEEFDAYQD